MGYGKCIGFCCCGSTFVVGFILLASWLTLKSISSPKASLLNLQLPVTVDNNTLSFMLKLENPNFSYGIQYSNLTTSFHYPKNQSSSFADVIVPTFYQGYQKKAVKTGTGETKKFNLNGTSVDVRVNVVGTVRFKRYDSWVTRRSLNIGVVAGVDKNGTFASEKGWHLKSGPAMKLSGIGYCLLLSLVIISSLGFSGFGL